MDIEDFICEKVAQLIATHRMTGYYTSSNAMRDELEKETEEVKFNKELRTVIRKLLNEE